jgi:imidazolonepropionase-like amidohydrolase
MPPSLDSPGLSALSASAATSPRASRCASPPVAKRLATPQLSRFVQRGHTARPSPIADDTEGGHVRAPNVRGFSSPPPSLVCRRDPVSSSEAEGSSMRFTIGLVPVLVLVASGAAAQQKTPTLVLEHANVYAGAKADALHDVTIVIADDRIRSIDPSPSTVATSSAARRIDLHGAWVLPGLIDAHVHVVDFPGVHRMLSLGVTTGRSMSVDGFKDVGLKTLYARGDKDIPDILSAAYPVVGHPLAFRPDLSSLFLDNPDLDDLRPRERIGEDGARRIVLDNAKRRVDWIKVFANGRAGVLIANPEDRDLNDAELTAAVQQATALGLPVAAHAYSDDGAAAAVRAGVRTIEHGSLITEPTLRLMQERAVCFVPTLTAFYESPAPGTTVSADDKALAARLQTMLQGAHAALAIARTLGVVVIAGTDTGYDVNDPTVVDEIQHLVDAGFSPAEALDSATLSAAACLGLEKRKGAIRPGLDADLVVYADDPLTDLRVLEKPLLVVTRGSVYLDRLGTGND